MEPSASDTESPTRLDQAQPAPEREGAVARQVDALIEIATKLDDLDLTDVPLRSSYDPGWFEVE